MKKQPQKDPNSLLYSACWDGNLSAVEIALRERPQSVNWAEPFHLRTCLIAACFEGHLEIAKLLCSKGADINKHSADGSTPLIVAVRHKHFEIIEFLLLHKADVEKADIHGQTPLIHSTTFGDEKTTQLLLSIGKAMPNHNNELGTKWSPLIYSTVNANYEVTKSLLEFGADANYESLNSESALIIAISNGNSKMVELLLQFGANSNSTTAKCILPLCFASASGRIEAIELLLKYGAEINKEDDNLMSPLACALKKKRFEISQAIAKAGGMITNSECLTLLEKQFGKEFIDSFLMFGLHIQIVLFGDCTNEKNTLFKACETFPKDMSMLENRIIQEKNATCSNNVSHLTRFFGINGRRIKATILNVENCERFQTVQNTMILANDDPIVVIGITILIRDLETTKESIIAWKDKVMEFGFSRMIFTFGIFTNQQESAVGIDEIRNFAHSLKIHFVPINLLTIAEDIQNTFRLILRKTIHQLSIPNQEHIHQQLLSLSMGLHSRLGISSPLSCIDSNVLQMIGEFLISSIPQSSISTFFSNPPTNK